MCIVGRSGWWFRQSCSCLVFYNHFMWVEKCTVITVHIFSKCVPYELSVKLCYYLLSSCAESWTLCYWRAMFVHCFPVSGVSSLLALSLLTLQAWRRFYETWFVSVYSNTQMNLSHYIVGYFHYFGSVMAILAESPGFIDDKGMFWHHVRRKTVVEQSSI